MDFLHAMDHIQEKTRNIELWVSVVLHSVFLVQKILDQTAFEHSYALIDLWLVQQWPSLIHTTHCFGNYAHLEVERNNPAQDRSPALIAINIQNTNQAFCLSLRKKPHLIFADFHSKKRLGFCGSDQNLSHACHRVHVVQYTSATNP